jgi:hypothetical protein
LNQQSCRNGNGLRYGKEVESIGFGDYVFAVSQKQMFSFLMSDWLHIVAIWYLEKHMREKCRKKKRRRKGRGGKGKNQA